MAVQVIGSERTESAFATVAAAPRPHLYVIDFTHGAAALPAPTIDIRRHALRRRRLSRRLRQAGEAVGWAAGSAVLMAMVFAGLAGLIH